MGINPLSEETDQPLDELVSLRGEIVHTARTTDTLYKAEVTEWRDFVDDLCSSVDDEARKHCKNWLST